MAQPFLFLASCCYGGLAHARYMRSVLALRAACAKRGIALQLDLGGGEALISRARAGMLAKFLASGATHLLFVDGDQAFDAEEVVGLLGPADLLSPDEGIFLIHRDAALEVVEAYSGLRASLSDVRGGNATAAPIVFESMIDPLNREYLSDLSGFVRRRRPDPPQRRRTRQSV